MKTKQYVKEIKKEMGREQKELELENDKKYESKK